MQTRAVSWRWSRASTLVAVGFTLGCGAGSDTGVPGGGSSTDPTNPEWPYTQPLSVFQACPEPFGNAEDLAATPRADENLESLALVVEPDRVVASQANYERVVADVAAIRALVPGLAPIEFRPSHDSRNVHISITDPGLEAWGMGAFCGMDRLNEALGATVDATDNWDLIAPRLVLRGIYNMPRVEQLYEQLPGINDAAIFEGPADGPTWCIARDGAEYEYVVDRATGDCSSGCQAHEAHRFSSEAAGKATPLEIWRSADGEPPPGWYARLCP